MAFTRYRCPACGQLGVAFDDEPFTCRNDSCAADARRDDPHRGETRAERARRHSFVYYLAFADRIKIGVTTSLEARLSNLPHDELLAVEPGDAALERRRHERFAHARVPGHREWFTRDPELLAHIAALSAGSSDVRSDALLAARRTLLGGDA